MSQRRILLTFSGARYHDTTKLIVERAMPLGATEPAWVYDDVWLKTKRPEFCAATKWAFDHPGCRGVNWFCWKPFVNIDAQRRVGPGDITCFTDADCWPVADMTPLFDMCDRDGAVIFAACSHRQRHWSKRDTQIVMGLDGMASDFWRNKQAGVARFMLFKKDAIIGNKWDPLTVEDFLTRWLVYTCHPIANTFDKSVLAPEYADVKEGRSEQAVLTNLAHMNSIPLHREADQWGNDFKKDFPNDTYGQIFESTGVYSYDPTGPREGSSFRNVHD